MSYFPNSRIPAGGSAAGLSPEERVKALAENAMVEINPAVKAICYVRTGKEMIRSAENYHEEGSYDHAYLLYMRFLTLFVEKIKEHPGYKELGDPEKKMMRSYCKSVLPLAENIKGKLLKQYEQEHRIYLEEAERLRIKYDEERRTADEERKRQAESKLKPSSNAFRTKDFSPSAPPGGPSAPFIAERDSRKPLPGYSKPGEYEGAPANGTAKTPQFDRTTKPSRLLSPMGSDSLRSVSIPGDLIKKFLMLASPNTATNIETCGVLAGNIVRDQLLVTHLIIPKQTGTADSCTTHNEEEIYSTIDRYSLIQMGWIHTHPSQTSFLSSVDLHTHLPYQLMMPESIAVVCAPSKQQCDVFTLTPTGIDILQNCTQAGFHPHPQLEEPYFTNASHSSFDKARSIVVEDVRQK